MRRTRSLSRRDSALLNGRNHVFSIETSKSLPQFHRGRRSRESSWVFGIVTTEFSPARGYFQVVERRDRASVLPIIQRCLLPRSVVHTDDWGAYHRLDHFLPNVAQHEVVVHARNFVDPDTGVHTQNIESAWSTMKQGIKARKGIRRCDLKAFLDERMWPQWRGDGNVMQNILEVLSLQYPNNPV